MTLADADYLVKRLAQRLPLSVGSLGAKVILMRWHEAGVGYRQALSLIGIWHVGAHPDSRIAPTPTSTPEVFSEVLP